MEAGIILVCSLFVRCLVINVFELEKLFTRFVTFNSASTNAFEIQYQWPVTYSYSVSFLTLLLCILE